MKKALKVILTVFGILFLLLLIAAIALALAVHDKTDRTIQAVKDADLDTETILHREMVNALDGAEGKDDVALLLDEYTVNELLYSIVSRAEIPFVTPVGAYAA